MRSAGSFESTIESLVASSRISRRVAFAALNDFFRSLHEFLFKADDDHDVLIGQVRAALGATAANSIARSLSVSAWSPTSDSEPGALERRLIDICLERGIPPDYGRGLFTGALIAFDRGLTTTSATRASPAVMAYWGIGREAAYHVAGLQLPGDDRNLAFEELKYLDYTLARYRTLLDRWAMERQWEKEAAE